MIVMFGAAVQQSPAESDKHHATGDADDRQRDAEEHKQMRADEHRPGQQEDAVDRHASRQRMALLVGNGLGQAKEYRRAADRIDDRKEPYIDEQEGVDELGHDAAV